MVSRAAAKSVRSSRRAVRAVQKVQSQAAPVERTLLGIATSRPARIAYVVIGSVGLAALAAAVMGPKRLQEDVFKPLRGAIEPQAEKLWDESRGLRDQIAGLFRNAGPSRDRLVRNFQSWIGHFHAT